MGLGLATLMHRHTICSGPEEEMMLLSAGTSVRRQAARERSRDLAGVIDWSRLAEMLRARGLLPTLGPRIVELAGDRAAAGFARAIERSLAIGRRQGALLQLTSTRVTGALAEAGIRSTALKGPLLGETIYGDPGRRQSRDIDLLVPAQRLSAAVQVVRQLGYRAPRDHVGPSGLPLLHFALAHQRGELPPVELHWRIHWYEQDFARERLLAPVADPSGQWRPAPIDELAALLLFYVRDGFIGLRLAADLSAWWDACGMRVQPAAFQELLESYPALRRALLAAVAVAERVVGIPAARIVGSSVALSARERMAARLANPHPNTTRPQLYADMGLIDWLLMPRGGLRELVRRQLLIPREVRVEHARHTGKRRPTSSLGHGTRVVGRYGLAVARLPLTKR